jgi:hypothetical protein
LPLPVAGGVSEIQFTSTVAVHAHSAEVESVTLPDEAENPTFWVVGDTLYRHGARCDTRACSSLTTIVPSREDAPSLGATRNDRLAAPCPDVGDNDEIQFALVPASHLHSGCVEIASDPVPPTASIVAGAVSETTHFTGLGPVLIVEDVSQLETIAAATRSRTAGFTSRQRSKRHSSVSRSGSCVTG